MKRSFIGEQHVRNQRLNILIQLDLRSRIRNASFPSGADHQVDHASLMLQRHQRHDVAYRAQVPAGVEFLGETR